MNTLDTYRFEQLDLNGLKVLVEWALQEQWNPGPHDAEIFYRTDPNGFIGIYNEDELIGGGSIVSYNGEFGFMGFFIIKSEYRAKGIGHKLWFERRNRLISRLNSGSAIGMDGVLNMQSFYQKGGFEISFRDERHEKIGESFDLDARISMISKSDYDLIKACDRKSFGFDRWNFMQHWLEIPDMKRFKFMENNQLKGFALMRPCAVGYKICPLFAEDMETAVALYKACLNSAIGKSVFLDIPTINPQAVELTSQFNTTYVFECARMYHGKPPELPIHEIYGITSFELG
jgi:hypothetical protein